MKRLSNKEAYDKLTTSECYVKTVSNADKNKVLKARGGTNPTTPASKIAHVAAELGLRAHADEPAPPPPPPPPTNPWDSGYPPLAYNELPDGEPSARYNVHINCTWDDGRKRWVGKNGDEYDEGGRETTGHRITKVVSGLKPANSMDNHEPWEAYEWFGLVVGPNKENYPAACYNR